MQFTPGGGVSFENATPAAMIQLAYEVQPFQVSGGPGWLRTERYNVIAKAPEGGGSQADARARLQALLAERFQLAIHREAKEGPVYALVAAKGGSKLQESDTGFDGISGSPGRLTAEQAPVALLGANLSRMRGRPVVDETGLKGRYKFDLQWSVEMDAAALDKSEAAGAKLTDTTSAPSIVSALQEQLGLRLESRKGPVETIVIDRAERPSGN
jgi:uncharacterized protein (TIGR03435 family)